jgi:adenosylcobinamide-GDP ribazoletransferase
MQQMRLFYTALMFLTRVPVPKSLPYSDAMLNRSRVYFPLVGLCVGIVGAIILLMLSMVLPLNLAVILSMVTTIIMTGAFHEDGFADSCDAFGGGYDKVAILEIMKDSRIGTYGGVGLILMLAVKFTALYELTLQNLYQACVIIMIGHGVSRYFSCLLIDRLDYVRFLGKSKPMASSSLTKWESLLTASFMLLPFVLLPKMLWLLPFLGLTTLLCGCYFKKHIGGYTGDCLGATQQINEVVFYLGGVMLWKFIS